MRRLLLLVVLAVGLAIPMVAFGENGPSPAAVAACKAEAAQLGNDAFVAKYGPTEPWGHCYALHSTAPVDDPATAACKAEYLQLGPDAFKAKYGNDEALGKCVSLQRTTTTTSTTTPVTPPSTGDAVMAACKAEYLQLGADAFKAKYGSSEAFGRCVATHKQQQALVKSVAQVLCKQHGKDGSSACLAKAQAILASCSSSTSKDALRACLAAALGSTTKRR